MINFEARCTSLKYGKPYDHGVNLQDIYLLWSISHSSVMLIVEDSIVTEL
jgi:hypothetical protein